MPWYIYCSVVKCLSTVLVYRMNYKTSQANCESGIGMNKKCRAFHSLNLMFCYKHFIRGIITILNSRLLLSNIICYFV